MREEHGAKLSGSYETDPERWPVGRPIAQKSIQVQALPPPCGVFNESCNHNVSVKMRYLQDLRGGSLVLV